MELVIRLVQETGLVIGIMACVTGGTIGGIGLVRLIGRIWSGKRFLKGGW